MQIILIHTPRSPPLLVASLPGFSYHGQARSDTTKWKIPDTLGERDHIHIIFLSVLL